ncbi:hypothetical protein OSTOST_22091 [Ostertagia ostertagi]
MFSDTNVREELRRTKRELKRLRLALPKLMKPTELLQRILTSCIMIYRLSPSSRDTLGEIERDAQILELRSETCELRFLYIRQCLRTLYAVVPILIATGKTSVEKWDAMMELKQYYYDNEGRRQDMLIHQATMEAIIEDQLNSINNLNAALKSTRITLMSEERTRRESSETKITESMNAVIHAIEEINRKMNSATIPPPAIPEAEAIDDDTRRRSHNVEEEAEPMEISNQVDQQERDTLEVKRRALEAKIQRIEMKINSLRKDLPCNPRKFITGLDRAKEKGMRCVFCGTPGDHYSDSCGRIRDSHTRKTLLAESSRCEKCLEIGCDGTETCQKYWNKCFHCGELDHHSAVCEKPDVALKILEEIHQLIVEIIRTRDNINSIRKRLRMAPFRTLF